MRTNTTKILGAVAVAGLVAATGSAFTGTGLTNNAGASQFVGGTVSQSVTGASLAGVVYAFSDTTNTAVNKITLTFADGADGKAVSVAPSGGSGGTFSCPVVTTGDTSICTFVEDPATTGTVEVGYTGLTSLSVTVAN